MGKITLNVVNYLEDNSFNANNIELNIKGDDINYQIINLLRKISYEDIPTLAFDINNIKIYENTSVYNNDYLRNRFENIPVMSIYNKLDLNIYDKILNNVININNFNNYDYNENEIIEENEIEIDETKKIDNKLDNIIEIYCDYNNTSTNNVYITSDDCKYYHNNKEINSIYKNKILFIILKPGENIKFTLKSDINIGMYHISYSPISIFSYDIINENEIKLRYESKDQLSVKNIFNYSIEIIKHKFNKLSNKIDNLNIENKSNGNIILNIEDNKLIDILILHLQKHENIKFAGFSKNLLTNIIVIEYILFDNKITIKSILNKIINNIIKIYDNLLNEFKKLQIK